MQKTIVSILNTNLFDRYNTNYDFPLMIVFKYKRKLFYSKYESFKSRVELMERKPANMHITRYNNASFYDFEGNKIEDSDILKMFNSKKVKVRGIILFNYLTKASSINKAKFWINTKDKEGAGVNVILNDIKFTSIPLDRKFRFY